MNEQNVTVSEWHGYTMETFMFEGREARVVLPKERDALGNWALKTEYWGAFPAVELGLLEHGFALATVKNVTRFATREDCDRKARFVRYVSETYGLRDKCVPVGMSCGGAHAANFAGYHPECVVCMYLDAPVLNFFDFPGRIGDAECEQVWENEFVKAFPGVTRVDLFGLEDHPVRRAAALIESRIPVLMVYGTEDRLVNYKDNGAILADAYRGHEDLIEIVPVICRGHHPHGMTRSNRPLIEWIVSHASAENK